MKRLQQLLEIPNKPDDYECVFQAISKLIDQRLSQSAINTFQTQPPKKPQEQIPQLNLDSMSVGFESSGKQLSL